MADDDRTELKADIAEDGRLTIPGEEGNYIPGAMAIRTLWLDVTNLSFQHFTQRIDEKVYRSPQIRGSATLEKDRLRLAGWGDSCQRLPFSIRAAPEADDGKSDLAWTSVIGFIPGDWEFRSSDEWFCEVLIPSEDFQALLVAYRAGALKRLSVGLKTDAWIRDGDQYTPIGYPVTWYLVPPTRDASVFPNNAKGTVEAFGWNDAGRALRGHDDEDEPVADEPQLEPAVPVQAPDRSAELIAGIDRLRKTVMRAALIIAGVVVIGWFT
jgi:hypothetical protein